MDVRDGCDAVGSQRELTSSALLGLNRDHRFGKNVFVRRRVELTEVCDRGVYRPVRRHLHLQPVLERRFQAATQAMDLMGSAGW